VRRGNQPRYFKISFSERYKNMLLVMEMCSNNDSVLIVVTRMRQFAMLSEVQEAAEFTEIITCIAYRIFSFIIVCKY
jgi:hypothetical protein